MNGFDLFHWAIMLKNSFGKIISSFNTSNNLSVEKNHSKRSANTHVDANDSSPIKSRAAAASTLSPRATPRPPSVADKDLSPALGIEGTATWMSPADNAELLPNKLMRMIDKKYISIDSAALIAGHDIFTEAEQCQVLRSAVTSADKLCLVTSYGVKPTGRKKDTELSPTIAAFLQGFAEKQHQANFTAVFFYQKSDAIQNHHIGEKRTLSSIKQQDWKKVIDMYNTAVETGKISGLKIDNIQAHLYFLAGEPKGFAGSHHSKFMLNDNGLCVTLGASLGNDKKANMMDTGCVTLSKNLAADQMAHFQKNQSLSAINSSLPGGRNNHCTRIEKNGDQIVQIDATVAKKEYKKAIKEIIESAQRKMQSQGADLSENEIGFFTQKFAHEGFDLGPMTKTCVAWINNPGTNQINQGMKKPIGIAFSEMLATAQANDVVCLRSGSENKFSAEVCQQIAQALGRGARVEILTSMRTELDQITYLHDQLSANLKGSPTEKQNALSRVDIKLFNLEENIFKQGEKRSSHGDFSKKGYKDHGKLFGVKKCDGSSIVMTGTYNLDPQSVLRSFENMQMIVDTKSKFLDAGFSNYYNAGQSPVNLGAQSRAELAQSVQALWKKIP